MLVATGLTEACQHGFHDDCDGRTPGYHPNCPCSCHHVRTTDGRCAMYGCDCHEQDGRHGLPFSRRHFTSCRLRIGA